MNAGGREVTGNGEDIVGCGMHREETLRRAGRPEPLSFSLSSPDRNVRAFGSIVEALSREVGPSRDPKFAQRRAVDLVLVGHPLGWGDPLLPEEFPHQLADGRGVASGLDEYVQDLAFGVDRSPKVHPSTADPDEHFVEVPSRVRHRAMRPQAARNLRSERHDPPWIVSYDTSIPRSASRSSMSRKLSVKRRYIQTARWMTSRGKR